MMTAQCLPLSCGRPLAWLMEGRRRAWTVVMRRLALRRWAATADAHRNAASAEAMSQTLPTALAEPLLTAATPASSAAPAAADPSAQPRLRAAAKRRANTTAAMGRAGKAAEATGEWRPPCPLVGSGLA